MSYNIIKEMRIFYGFLIMAVSALLWLLPVTEAIYDFRTDVRHEEHAYETGGAETTANVVLEQPVYDEDTTTLSIVSDLATDIPTFSAYNATTQLLDITGMTASSNRTLTVTFDADALLDNDAISLLMDYMPFFWTILIICFPIGGIAAVWLGRA